MKISNLVNTKSFNVYLLVFKKKNKQAKTVKINNTKQEQQIDIMTKIVFNHGKTS